MTTDLTYNPNGDGIHIFTFLRSSRPAVDTLFEHMHTIVQTTPQGGMMAIVADGSALDGVPPLAHIFRQARQFTSTYNNAPRSRTAIIYSQGFALSLVQSFLQTLNQYNKGYHQTRFFKAHQYDEALDWLRHELETHA